MKFAVCVVVLICFWDRRSRCSPDWCRSNLPATASQCWDYRYKPPGLATEICLKQRQNWPDMVGHIWDQPALHIEFQARKPHYTVSKTRLRDGSWFKRTGFFQKTWVRFSAPTRQFLIICNTSSAGYGALFWPPRALNTRVQTHKQNTHIHNEIKYIKNK